ncbi:TFIIB-type zinc ribbon-containing protein [Vibrio penaeicida]|uniref:TFIIB-type zinc ribbon-containing protein n=1 Tax=Vibrio penaeicida TaxID=104609 RepID=UPI000CEA5CB7|nr:zf-TFIIB domain-containing protein [Vibrio penaeicida]
MKCTSCNTGVLEPKFIDGMFPAHICNECEGNWILVEDYVAWKEDNPAYPISNSVTCEISDTETALLCPQTGTIMRKLRISSNISHRLDYSVAVGGIWLDKGEWSIIREGGLANSLNAVVTTQWQKNIRTNNSTENFVSLYNDKFGEETYEKLKDIRSWINAHPNKHDLQAYLSAEDPYSAER